ncbi:MAG: hypothetical protein WC030_03300 [Candidatus Paceibacterota bacterium]
MNTHKGFINPLWLVVALVIVIGGGAAWWFAQKPAPQSENTAPVQVPIVNEETKAQPQAQQTRLSKYLSQVTPQIVTEEKRLPEALARPIQKALADIVNIQEAVKPKRRAPAEEPPYLFNEDEILLVAVGKRYVLFNVIIGTDCGVPPFIVDATTATLTKIPRPLFLTEKTIVFAGTSAFYTYDADAPALVEIPGSRIGDNESFISTVEGMCGGSLHYENSGGSITVEVGAFQGTGPNNEDPIPGPRRKLTFALPQ